LVFVEVVLVIMHECTLTDFQKFSNCFSIITVDDLIQAANSCSTGETELEIEIMMSFDRGSDSDILTGRNSATLTREACANITNILVNKVWGGYFEVYDLYPRFELL
jgi:hypothetical protein